MAKVNGKKNAAKSAAKASASDQADERRAAFKRWLQHNDLNANEAAKKAGISVSAIYNFLNGDTKSLSSNILLKLAIANACTIDDILNGQPRATGAKNAKIRIVYRVGARGSMFLNADVLYTSAPAGVTLPDGISAALVDGDGLAPIPDGWTVFFRDQPSPAASLVGKLACVRFSGGGDRPVVRTILASDHAGLHSLKSLDGSLTEDVKIMAAHEIVSFALTDISSS